MKIIFFLLIALLGFTVQSQSLTEKEISGTWIVVAIAESGTYPEEAKVMERAYFDLYPDHRFQLRMKSKNKTEKGYEAMYQNYTWRFDPSAQTVYLSNDTFPIKINRENDKVYFELLGTGTKLEVLRPM